MLKLEFAEWIRQVLFPVQAFEGAGSYGLHYRDRTNASLRPGGMVFRVIALVWREICRRRDAHRTILALQACSDHTLRDIGVDRSEIFSVAHLGGAGHKK